jgi:hypothetical protein
MPFSIKTNLGRSVEMVVERGDWREEIGEKEWEIGFDYRIEQLICLNSFLCNLAASKKINKI